MVGSPDEETRRPFFRDGLGQKESDRGLGRRVDDECREPPRGRR
jgi:hypothetical protein